MISRDRPVFSLRELSTDLKTHIFTFKVLVKPLDFLVKNYTNIVYMRIVKKMLRLFLYFRSETRISRE